MNEPTPLPPTTTTTMRSHTVTQALFLLVVTLSSSIFAPMVAAANSDSITNSIRTGKPHSTVQTLTEDNFNDALDDPANGLWLLKFYGMLFLCF